MNKNVIAFKKSEVSNEKVTMIPSESIRTIIPVEFVYGQDTEELFGTNTLYGIEKLASIEVLNKDIEEQKEALIKGIDKYGNETEVDELYPWSEVEFIVCKEGIFHWEWNPGHYKYYGQVEEFVKKKIVRILKEVVINIGNEQIHLYRGASYHVSGEYEAYDDQMQPLVMLNISQEGCVPVLIPYDSEMLTIEEVDFAVVNLLNLLE